eukprot:1159676-Pelagomonas_calceolata.AAC.2
MSGSAEDWYPTSNIHGGMTLLIWCAAGYSTLCRVFQLAIPVPVNLKWIEYKMEQTPRAGALARKCWAPLMSHVTYQYNAVPSKAG